MRRAATPGRPSGEEAYELGEVRAIRCVRRHPEPHIEALASRQLLRVVARFVEVADRVDQTVCLGLLRGVGAILRVVTNRGPASFA